MDLDTRRGDDVPDRAGVREARFRDHPLRGALTHEVHARPFESLEAPERASHLGMVSDEAGLKADYEHVVALCGRYGVAPPPEGSKHFGGDFGAFRLKWERHREFCTYTFFLRGPFEDPFDDPVICHLPADWLEATRGERLVAVHIALEPLDSPPRGAESLAQMFFPDTLVGSRLSGDTAVAWTDFQIHEDGFGRILVKDRGLEKRKAGRLVQRLLEIETYRMMALLALPLVNVLRPRMRRIEGGLADIAGRMTSIEELEDTRAMLADLSQLSAEIEEITARASYRIDASCAYYALVRRRTERLREERIEGLQTIDEFMERRLAPAMQTCETFDQNRESLSCRLTRASDLLRTRVDVALEGQNRDLLESMDRRARLQQRLQRILQVISIVALTYYLSLLFATVLKALEATGISINIDLMTGAAIPFMIGLVWLGLWWARRVIAREHGDGGS
jgi:uncharacterized membrane-anchored protein